MKTQFRRNFGASLVLCHPTEAYLVTCCCRNLTLSEFTGRARNIAQQQIHLQSHNPEDGGWQYSSWWFYLHFTDEEVGPRRLSDLTAGPRAGKRLCWDLSSGNQAQCLWSLTWGRLSPAAASKHSRHFLRDLFNRMASKNRSDHNKEVGVELG